MKPLYLLIENQTVGPLDVWEIRERLKRQEINAATLWAEEGGEEWKPVFELPAFAPPKPAPVRAQSNAISGWVWAGVFIALAAIALGAVMFGLGGAGAFGVGICGLVLGAFIYFIPALIAANRNHPNAVAISVLNLVAGWTFLGWVIALVWSLTESKR